MNFRLNCTSTDSIKFFRKKKTLQKRDPEVTAVELGRAVTCSF